jgi:hypothetical protein
MVSLNISGLSCELRFIEYLKLFTNRLILKTFTHLKFDICEGQIFRACAKVAAKVATERYVLSLNCLNHKLIQSASRRIIAISKIIKCLLYIDIDLLRCNRYNFVNIIKNVPHANSLRTDYDVENTIGNALSL